MNDGEQIEPVETLQQEHAAHLAEQLLRRMENGETLSLTHQGRTTHWRLFLGPHPINPYVVQAMVALQIAALIDGAERSGAAE